MSNAELAKLVLDLKAKGYTPSPQCWHLSISWVSYECGEHFSVMYVSEDAPPFILRQYDVHPNES